MSTNSNFNTMAQNQQLPIFGTVDDQERVDNVRSCMGQYFLFPGTSKPPINRGLLLASLSSAITTLTDADLEGVHRLVLKMLDNPPGAGAFEMSKIYQDIHNKAVWEWANGK